MAQGANKLKSKGFNLRKEKNRPKKQQMKKGARYIAPKKAKVMEQAKLKKGLDKAIKANIEQEITQKVKSVEGKTFNVVTAPSTSKQSNDAVKTKQK
ncbi:UPF0390 protein zgc136864-like [Ruditapes philippinarum]|uniref:UPF0390 protein zgc136864-like n=1 Tax=Ruditapes philippinarum TaxID=129788 RepID=UPI00295B18EC|nr:UPF0390 protein zgc136864-like [Ruditapes philippinarum]